MDIKPDLFFNGQARDAVTMYEDTFGIDLPEMLTMEGSSVMVFLPTAVNARRVFDRLSDGGEI